ncbi:MAG: AAA family ATPase [Candidatus Aminicenantes bacterium]|nr:AAA family ATPase [Candidatus Aminicenantes bacterium]
MKKEKKTANPSRQEISLKNLYLDPNNFRLIHEQDYVETPTSKIKDKVVSQRTFRLIAGERNQNIQDLIESFKASGYLPIDQIQIKELENGDYMVVEGNRRVAALKLLANEYETKNIDLGNLHPSIFDNVPVVMYEDGDDMHYLTLMALKHISGNKKWGEWNQAKLLEKMYLSHHLEEDEICRRIGISKIELRRSLRALSLVEQYRNSDYGDQFDESKFPIFREVARNADLKVWLDWDDSSYKAKNTANLEFFFSWLSREPIEEPGDDGQVGYGKKFRDPAIIKRDDVVTLGKIITDTRAMAQLKSTRDINAAYRASDLVFRERQEAAIKSLANEIDILSQMTIREGYLPEVGNAIGRLQSIVDKTRASGLFGVEQKTVFHDRIDSHFSELEVSNYKVLQQLRLKKLSKVNLLAGINNSGKTTLLEAIYLLSRQNDFDGLLEVLRRRGKISEEHLNPEWFIDQLPQEIKIQGVFDNRDASVSIRHYKEENSGIDKTLYLETVEITSSFGAIKQEASTRIYKGEKRETHAGHIKLLCPTIYSSPFFLNEPHRYAPFYHKSMQSKALPKIFDFINKHFIPSVSDIRLVDESRRFLVNDRDFQVAPDLTDYGEGVQRVFFISLIFAAAQNGVVLIDEFENAIHTALISKFAGFIYDLTREFNIQLFLTSHSKECIDAFVLGIPEADIKDFSAIALVEKEKKIIAREFSGVEFKNLVEAGDVDLRRAR